MVPLAGSRHVKKNRANTEDFCFDIRFETVCIDKVPDAEHMYALVVAECIVKQLDIGCSDTDEGILLEIWSS